jgi:hypothetical protein
MESNMTDQQIEKLVTVAALRVQIMTLKAERNSRAGYSMNRDFQLECAVKTQMIIELQTVLDRLEVVI